MDRLLPSVLPARSHSSTIGYPLFLAGRIVLTCLPFQGFIRVGKRCSYLPLHVLAGPRHNSGKLKQNIPYSQGSTRNTGRYDAEKRLLITRGGRGVIPLPPPFFFFKEGGTPPPICRASRGPPPSPRDEKEGTTHIPKNPENPNPHDGCSTRNTGDAPEKQGSFRDQGGGGWPPYPPSFFFSGGGHPPTHVPAQQGVTPLPLCWAGRGGLPLLPLGPDKRDNHSMILYRPDKRKPRDYSPVQSRCRRTDTNNFINRTINA